ncbi:MAG: type II toxin-antitoxin system HicB family antitoxin [Gemmatimonadetes bacterium]|nr:type II toxin-antitoxin system HicB family antitoxin [Gemmatimonadota bacterium]
MPKDVAYYRALPYRRVVEVRQDTAGRAYYLAYVAEIPGIRIDGATREEALMKLDEIFDELMQALIEEGQQIPEPEPWPGSALQQVPSAVYTGEAPVAVSIVEATLGNTERHTPRPSWSPMRDESATTAGAVA